MNRQRLILFAILTLAFVGVSLLYFVRVWDDSNNRFLTGLPVPRSILPDELLRPEELIPSGPPRLPPLRADDPILSGTSDSSVTIVAFGDFQCEFCRDQAKAIEDALRLIDRPRDVRVVWRNLPLVNQHPRAMAAATVAQCAAQQGKFKGMHDALFFQATDLSDAEFLQFASQLQLNKDQLLVCLRDPAIPFRLNQDLDEARQHAITEVPLLFVNGQPLSGYVDAETLAIIIRKQLGQ